MTCILTTFREKSGAVLARELRLTSNTVIFFGFTKSGNSIKMASIPAMVVVYAGAQRLSNDKLKDALNATATNRAFGLAVEHLEQTTKDAALRKKIVDLKAKQAETNERVKKIDIDLRRELER